MIYLFGIRDKVSIIMNERYLTQQEQANATLVVETLPEPEVREGFYSVLYIDEITKELSYKYIEKTTEQLQYEKLQKLVDDGKVTQEEMTDILGSV